MYNVLQKILVDKIKESSEKIFKAQDEDIHIEEMSVDNDIISITSSGLKDSRFNVLSRTLKVKGFLRSNDLDINFNFETKVRS